MIKIAIPGYGDLRLTHLVLDYNGTLAIDGRLLNGVADRLKALSAELDIHVITADTFGRAAVSLDGLPCRLTILPAGEQAAAKQSFVRQLGAAGCVCVGNGRNDRLMLREAALGIVVLQAEGTAVSTLTAADLTAPDIQTALDLLTHPLRLVAALRS